MTDYYQREIFSCLSLKMVTYFDIVSAMCSYCIVGLMYIFCQLLYYIYYIYIILYYTLSLPHPCLLSLYTAAFVPSGEEVQFGFGHSHSVCLPAQHSTGVSGE